MFSVKKANFDKRREGKITRIRNIIRPDDGDDQGWINSAFLKGAMRK